MCIYQHWIIFSSFFPSYVSHMYVFVGEIRETIGGGEKNWSLESNEEISGNFVEKALTHRDITRNFSSGWKYFAWKWKFRGDFGTSKKIQDFQKFLSSSIFIKKSSSKNFNWYEIVTSFKFLSSQSLTFIYRV